MNRENLSTIIFTDDFSRIRFRWPLLQRILDRSLFGSMIRAHSGQRALFIGSEGAKRLAERAGIGFRSFGTVLIQGISRASALSLFPLVDEILRLLRAHSKFRSRSGVAVADGLVIRFLFVQLTEIVFNANAVMELLQKLKPRSVTVSAANSALEAMIAGVAAHEGVESRITPANPILSLTTHLKNWLAMRRKPVGRLRNMDELWEQQCGSFPAESKKFDVVIFCEEERRFDRSVELLNNFRELGHSAVILCMPSKKAARLRIPNLRDQHGDIAVLPHFLSAEERVQIRAVCVSDISSAWHAVTASSIIRDYRFLGFPLWRLFGARIGLSWGPLYLCTANALAASENCLRALDPKVVVAVDNSLYAKSLLEVARGQGRKTISYLDNPNVCSMAFWPEVLARYFPVDAMIATSGMIREGIVNRFCYPESRVFTIGAPSGQAAHAPTSLSIRRGKPVVLMLSSYISPDISSEFRRSFHRLVADAARAAGFDLIVRAHPNDDLEQFQQELAESNVEPILLSQKENVQSVLAESDLACIIFSQAGLEVLRGQKPLFVFQDELMADSYEDIIPYAKSGAAEYVNPYSESVENLARKFRASAEDPLVRAAQIQRGQNLFRAQSTAELDPGELERLRDFLRERK